MANIYTLKIYMIMAEISEGHPKIVKIAKGGDQTSIESALKEADAFAAGKAPHIQWNKASEKQGHHWPDTMEFDCASHGKEVHVFFLEGSCEATFDKKMPFLDVNLAGAPENGFLNQCGLLNGHDRWAYVVFNPCGIDIYKRVPIIFNYVNNHTNRSPFFLGQHNDGPSSRKENNLRSGSKVTGDFHDDLDQQRFHDGIHPPTVSSNANIL